MTSRQALAARSNTVLTISDRFIGGVQDHDRPRFYLARISGVLQQYVELRECVSSQQQFSPPGNPAWRKGNI
jgi:hypothetical protein